MNMVTGETDVRRLEEQPVIQQNASSNDDEVVFEISVKLSKTSVAKCQSQEAFIAAALAFFKQWRKDHPQNPPADDQAEFLNLVPNMNMAKPEVDLSDPDPEHFAHNATFGIQKQTSKEIFTLECRKLCIAFNFVCNFFFDCSTSILLSIFF